jgi:peptide/nickel transport system permease protein
MKYLLRHLGLYLLAAWVSITLNFILPRAMPGDPVSTLVGKMHGRLTPEAIEGIKAMYGFTKGDIFSQYGQYLSHVCRGDFGLSLSAYPAKVSTIIQSALGWTLLLGLTVTILSFVIGTMLGIAVGWKRGGRLDAVLPGVFSFLGSFPYFFFAMLALFFMGFSWRWFPMAHAYSDFLSPGLSWEFAGSVAYHLVLPAATVILVSVGGWLIGMRSTMVGVISEDYITLAEAKGLPERDVMYRYAARNAILPNVTQFGMSIGFVFGGQILTEIVFSYPGLGFYLVRAVTSHDYPLMQALFLMITLAILIANFAMDLLYVRLDPRVRTR